MVFKKLLILAVFISILCILLACISVYYGYAWYYWRLEGGIGSDVCELPYRSWELNPGPLKKKEGR